MPSNTQDVKYTLKHPITLGSETITEVTIGRVKAKHMRALPMKAGAGQKLDATVDFIAKVLGEFTKVVDEMDAEDFTEISNIVGERMGSGQPTGPTA
jgi:hypothetical protein